MSDLQAEFQEITDPIEAENYLNESVRSLAATLAWTSNQSVVLNTHIVSFSKSDGNLYVFSGKKKQADTFVASIHQDTSGNAMFTLSLKKATIFFKARFEAWDDLGLRFSLPEKIFKVQRRKHFRLPIPSDYKLYVTFNDPMFSAHVLRKRVIDISLGGLGIEVDDAEEAIFDKGVVLEKMSFPLKERKILCRAQVCYCRPLPNADKQPKYKLGVKFITMSETDRQAIASYVFTESRKYYTKIL